MKVTRLQRGYRINLSDKEMDALVRFVMASDYPETMPSDDHQAVAAMERVYQIGGTIHDDRREQH